MTFSSKIKSLKKIPSGLLMSASKRIESFYLNGDAIQDCKKKGEYTMGHEWPTVALTHLFK